MGISFGLLRDGQWRRVEEGGAPMVIPARDWRVLMRSYQTTLDTARNLTECIVSLIQRWSLGRVDEQLAFDEIDQLCKVAQLDHLDEDQDFLNELEDRIASLESDAAPEVH